MKKTLLSVIIIALVAVLSVPVCVFAEKTDDKRSEDGKEYSIYKDKGFKYFIKGNTANIISYTGKKSKLVIPQKLSGKKVTRLLYEGGFPDTVTSISLPRTLKVIDTSAGLTTPEGRYYFYGSFFMCDCGKEGGLDYGKNLKKITVSKKNKYFSASNGVLFNKKKTKLIYYPCAKTAKKYTVPSTVKEIYGGAFARSKVSNIELPDKLKFIGALAFANSKIKSAVIPSTVKNKGIGSGAFVDCHKLTKLKLSKNLTLIPPAMLAYAANLKTITIPDKVKTIDELAFCECKKLKKVKLGNKLKKIENHAFVACSKLKSITVPKSVKKIEYAALGFDDYERKVKGFKIYGKKGSAAEKYAKKNKIKFKKI